LRLAGGLGLFLVNFPLAVQGFLRHFLAAQESRVERGHVHGHVVAQALEVRRARDEIALAIHLDQHADLPARVDIGAHQPFGRRPLRFLGGRGLALLAQDVDGLLDIAFGFHERIAAGSEARASAVAQFLHQLRGDIRISGCGHRFTRFL